MTTLSMCREELAIEIDEFASQISHWDITSKLTDSHLRREMLDELNSMQARLDAMTTTLVGAIGDWRFDGRTFTIRSISPAGTIENFSRTDESLVRQLWAIRDRLVFDAFLTISPMPHGGHDVWIERPFANVNPIAGVGNGVDF